MKIEKINDNQIRCTLTREDLESHQIRISELAYGTDKAKKLFRDMMQQAQIQFGFEADNIPLMIEAIPVSTESIIPVSYTHLDFLLIHLDNLMSRSLQQTVHDCLSHSWRIKGL